MNNADEIASLERMVDHLRSHYERAKANGWREAADWAYELRIYATRLNFARKD